MNHQGYSILKNNTDYNINELKKQLTVKPYIPVKYNKNVKSFPVYVETKDKLIIPRYYAEEFLGEKMELKKIGKNGKTKIEFKGKLFEQQMEIMTQVYKKIKKTKGGMVSLPCGMGKCFGRGTKILLHNYKIKNVEDINIGDKIMGDDLTSREVISLVGGVDNMYKIIQPCGKNYIINSEHIISVIGLDMKKYDISINEFYKRPNFYHGYKKSLLIKKSDVNINNFDIIKKNYKLEEYYQIENSDSLEIIPKNEIYKIKIKKLNIDNYFGFEISGKNRRFLLNDLTVAHNTVCSLYLASLLKRKTLVVVHKSFLLNQWKERIEQFTDATVGMIRQDKIEIENCNIVIGMLQSLIIDNKYNKSLFKHFGLVIFDEAHHAPSECFSRALPIISTEYMLALSATPKRSDKLEKVIHWYFGPMLYQITDSRKINVLVKKYNYHISNKNFKEAMLPFGKDVNLPKTINRLCSLDKRNQFIVSLIEEIIIEDGRKLLILSDRITHLEELKKLLDNNQILDNDFYIGKMKQKKLDEASKAQIILGSYSMASEALDIPELNTLLMVTSRRNIEQSVGRILRKPSNIIQPLIIDICDQLNCFQRQGISREKYYKKKGYTLKTFNMFNNEIIKEQDGYNDGNNVIENNDIDFID